MLKNRMNNFDDTIERSFKMNKFVILANVSQTTNETIYYTFGRCKDNKSEFVLKGNIDIENAQTIIEGLCVLENKNETILENTVYTNKYTLNSKTKRPYLYVVRSVEKGSNEWFDLLEDKMDKLTNNYILEEYIKDDSLSFSTINIKVIELFDGSIRPSLSVVK